MMLSQVDRRPFRHAATHDRHVRLWGIAATALAITSLSCNERSPVLDTAAVTQSGPSAVVPENVSAVNLVIDPPAVMGGATTFGTVTIDRGAPDGGVPIGIRSGDPAVVVPSSVVIGAGARQATFVITTQSVSSDRTVGITASAPGASVGAALPVWAVLPTFLSAVGDDGYGFFGKGGFRRYTPSNARFSARCSQSEVDIFVDADGESSFAIFSAPRGTPLRQGTYENASRSAFRDATQPGIDITVMGGCNTIQGRFIVHEVDLTANARVNRFWATFEQRCDNKPAALRGEIRVSGISSNDSAVSTCVVR